MDVLLKELFKKKKASRNDSSINHRHMARPTIEILSHVLQDRHPGPNASRRRRIQLHHQHDDHKMNIIMREIHSSSLGVGWVQSSRPLFPVKWGHLIVQTHYHACHGYQPRYGSYGIELGVHNHGCYISPKFNTFGVI